MSRISEYSLDTTVESSDKLLGSNSDGSTKNFKVDDLSIFISETNTSGTSSSFTFKYRQSNPGNGDMKFTLSSGSTLANVTSLKVNKFNYDNYDNVIINALILLSGKDIIVYEINNRNNFGVYKVNSLQVDSDSNFYNLALTAITSNGSIVNDKIYGVDIFPESGGDKTGELVFTSSSFATSGGSLLTETINGSSMPYVVFNHNLGKKPSISVEQEGSPGQVALMPVKYINNSTVRVYFTGTTSGKIYAN